MDLSGMKNKKKLLKKLDRHSRLAAKARRILYNGGHGPNLTQQQRIDELLRKIAG
jgi:hypothetical protein